MIRMEGLPTASWNGETVAISCAMVSRYAWTTASIDVAVGDKVILRTGGVQKFTGSHSESFEHRGSQHTAQLTWGVSFGRHFPVALNIDGYKVIACRVPISNWWLAWWPLCATLGALALWLALR
jgi:hypothetical protein